MGKKWGRVLATAATVPVLAACWAPAPPPTNPAIFLSDGQLAGAWREPVDGGVLVLEADGRFTATGVPDAVSDEYPSLLADSGKHFHRPAADGTWTARVRCHDLGPIRGRMDSD